MSTTTTEVKGRPRKFWTALGTPRAVRGITVLMLVYAVIIGALVFGYAKVSSCLASYANTSAVSQAVRSNAATEDRRLNDAEGRLADSDRARYRADQKAMNTALATLLDPATPREARGAAFVKLLAENQKTSEVLDVNEGERRKIRQERERIEADRSRNPVPPPPSETC